MKLSDKILNMEKEVGLLPMLCVEQGCKDRNIGKLPDKYFGRRHCMEQIPYVKNTVIRIHIIELCTYKIQEYYKK